MASRAPAQAAAAAAAENQPASAAVRPAAIPEKFDGARGSDRTS